MEEEICVEFLSVSCDLSEYLPAEVSILVHGTFLVGLLNLGYLRATFWTVIQALILVIAMARLDSLGLSD